MSFEISQLKNKYLQDIATVVDNNNDGVINNGNEISIFLEKSQNLVSVGLCSEAEYSEILGYCPREVNTRGGKLQIGTQEYVPNEKAQQAYVEKLKSEVDQELEAKNLEKTPENISITTELIKKRKDLSVQIKIQEAKIEKLKMQRPEDKFEQGKEVTTSCSMAAGAVGGAWLGFKVGASFGVPGMVIGAALGGLVGSIATGVTGSLVFDAVLPEDKLNQSKAEIQKELATESEKLKELKEEYAKLN